MWRSKLSGILVALLVVPLALAANNNTQTAAPGAVNYVEGSVALNGTALNTKSVGSSQLEAGQSISTESGKTEFLLTPGVYVRLGDNSKATLVSPSLTKTEVSVDQGEAMVEVDEIHKQNNIQIVENGVSTELLKTGLYDFNSSQKTLEVFSGEAMVQENDQRVKLKSDHELNLASSGKLKAAKFDKGPAENTDLYRWSSLRSDYLAEANIDAAGVYYAGGAYGPGWIGSGWYWDPWLTGYTFLPAYAGFYSPFGWPFYSPYFVYNSPLWYRGFYGRSVAGVRPPVRDGRVGPVGHEGFRAGNGFHGGFSGGGFHGGGGGFGAGGGGFGGGHR